MEKIKAIDPKIVVSGSADKPYYSIEYYNILDERWHIGYGSYNLKFVKEWLNDDFEIVEADVAPICHGHWIEEYDCGYITPHCSECGETALTKEETSYDYVYSSYCPHCGAKMGKTE